MAKKIIILIVCVVIAYMIGNWFPIEKLKPQLTEEPIAKVEYYKLVVSIIAAFITFVAVLVALFKDDLREKWKFARVNFNTPANMTIEVTTDSSNSDSAEIIQAIKYISRIEVHNTGNLPTMNAEIYLDDLQYIPKDSTIPQLIETTGTPLKWNGTESETIIIPPGGRKLIQIVEVIAPEKISLPDSEKINKPPQLIIGNISNLKDQLKGKWIATFTLYAQNHKSKSFKIEIEWNGLWKARLMEMNNYFKIEKKA